MNADNILFRASSIGYIMTEPRSKSETLSESTKTHLVDVFVSAKYGRQSDIQNRFTSKGLLVEEDSITLYSRASKRFYKKNDERLLNSYICGTPDLFEGKSIKEADLIIDIKSSYDIFTFFRANNESLNKKYYWQLQAYMALTGAKKSKLAYCLINTPPALINDEKRKLQWKMNVIDDSDKDFEDACAAIDKLHTYDDIPLNERFFEVEVNRNDEDIAKIYDRVKLCRKWMDENLFKEKPEPVYEVSYIAEAPKIDYSEKIKQGKTLQKLTSKTAI